MQEKIFKYIENSELPSGSERDFLHPQSGSATFAFSRYIANHLIACGSVMWWDTKKSHRVARRNGFFLVMSDEF